MNEQEARLILQAYRPGADPDDPEVAAALQEAARNPELARWFAEEQAFDRAIAAHLGNVPAPFGLKTRILAQLGPPAAPHRWSWAVKLAGVAALLFLLTQVVSLFRPAAPEAQVSNYAREMVSFVRLGAAARHGEPAISDKSKNGFRKRKRRQGLCHRAWLLCSRWAADSFPFAVKRSR